MIEQAIFCVCDRYPTITIFHDTPIPAILDDCDDPLDCDGRIAIAILHAFSPSRLRAISCVWIATSYARDDDIINRHTITTTAINPNICKALYVLTHHDASCSGPQFCGCVPVESFL